jgi:hypothetical protein
MEVIPISWKLGIAGAAIVAALSLGVFGGYWFFGRGTQAGKEVNEKDAPSVVFSSGGVMASRETQSREVVKKILKIPEIKINDVERLSTFQLQPKNLGAIDLQLVQTKDESGGHRITIKADNADVTGAREIVIPYDGSMNLHWNAQILYELTKNKGKHEIGAEVKYQEKYFSVSIGGFPGRKQLFAGVGYSW